MSKEKLCTKDKCFIFSKSNKEAVIIYLFDERSKDAYIKFRKELLKIFDSTKDSEKTIYFRIEELDPIFSEKEEQEVKNICPRVERCFFLWREKPKGLGESSVIIVPLEQHAIESYQTFQKILLEIFDSTTDSEETIYFRIEDFQ